MKKQQQPKPKELPKCIYCGKDVHMKIDGGKARIPTCVTYGQFPEYSKDIIIHNACLNSLVATIIRKRKPLKDVILPIAKGV